MVALAAKLTARMPAVIWMVPYAKNQPHFFLMPIASTVSTAAGRFFALAVMFDSPGRMRHESQRPQRCRARRPTFLRRRLFVGSASSWPFEQLPPQQVGLDLGAAGQETCHHEQLSASSGLKKGACCDGIVKV
jgi:hypothetical protein